MTVVALVSVALSSTEESLDVFSKTRSYITHLSVVSGRKSRWLMSSRSRSSLCLSRVWLSPTSTTNLWVSVFLCHFVSSSSFVS